MEMEYVLDEDATELEEFLEAEELKAEMNDMFGYGWEDRHKKVIRFQHQRELQRRQATI
jgi:hypothetical protein